MKQALVFTALVVLGMVIFPTDMSWAQTTTSTVTTDQEALQLTQNLYCGIKSAFASPTAMFIGLALAIAGLWKMIQGNVGGGLVFIICGALLGAIPSLAESFLNGVGSSIGTLTASPTITPPSC